MASPPDNWHLVCKEELWTTVEQFDWLEEQVSLSSLSQQQAVEKVSLSSLSSSSIADWPAPLVSAPLVSAPLVSEARSSMDACVFHNLEDNWPSTEDEWLFPAPDETLLQMKPCPEDDWPCPAPDESFAEVFIAPAICKICRKQDPWSNLHGLCQECDHKDWSNLQAWKKKTFPLAEAIKRQANKMPK